MYSSWYKTYTWKILWKQEVSKNLNSYCKTTENLKFHATTSNGLFLTSFCLYYMLASKNSVASIGQKNA